MVQNKINLANNLYYMSNNKAKLYISKEFLTIFIKVLLAVICLTLFIDIVELLRKFANDGLNPIQIIHLSLLKQTHLYVEILPFIILIASIIFFTKLSSTNELTILKTSGLSNSSIFLGPIMLIAIIFLLEIFVLHPIAKKSNIFYQEKLNKYLNIKAAKIETSNLWFKANNQNDKFIINSEQIIFKQDKLEFTKLNLFFINHEKIKFINSSKAYLANNLLSLTDSIIYNLQEKNEASKIEVININITRDDIEKIINTTQKLNHNNFNLINIIKIIILKQADPEIIAQSIIMLNHIIAKLCSYVSIFLLAAYLCIFPPRYNKKIINITATIILGFIIFFILNISYNFALSAKIPIFHGIWLPNFLLLFSLIYLHLKKELGYSLWT